MDESKKKELSTTQVILIVGFLCLFIVIGIATYFIIKSQDHPETPLPSPVTGGNLVIDESNLAAIEEQLADSVADGMFEINMNTIWNFPDGKSASSDAYVANGRANNYPITFEVLLNGTDIIYSSTVIPVGNQIREIILDKELVAGTYQAVCMYYLWNEDGTENSSCGVSITLRISK